MNPVQPPIVLILRTGNSCRSQMAEGGLRHAAGDLLDVRSAGSKPVGRVNPLAIRALAERPDWIRAAHGSEKAAS